MLQTQMLSIKLINTYTFIRCNQDLSLSKIWIGEKRPKSREKEGETGTDFGDYNKKNTV